MAFNPLPGYAASAGGYSFDEFKFSPKNNLSKVNNFNGGGYEQFLKGMTGGKITCSGPYDQGNMAFAVGNAYTLDLAFSVSATVSCPVLCESIDVGVKTDDAERVSVTFQITGAFTAAIT